MKYIGYFDDNQTGSIPRSVFWAGKNKMQYIAKTIAKFEPVEIISPSGVTGEKMSFGAQKVVGDNISLRLFFSLGRKKYVGKLSTLITMICFAVYIFSHTHRDDDGC